MKKLFSIILLACTLVQLAHSQEMPEELPAPAPDYPKNELGGSLILGTSLQGTAVAATLLVSIVGSAIANDAFAIIPIFVPVGIEYNRWINEKLAVGASLNADTISALPYLGVCSLSLVPDVKYRWASLHNLNIYSKAGVGLRVLLAAQMQDGRLEVIEALSSLRAESFEAFDLGSLYSRFVLLSPVAWQVSPLCFEVNTAANNLVFYLELGGGVQGSFNLGLKKMF
ncbi:MAG: hypothetical protein IKZ91_03535 [Bacteroidales bacterium]|nr:hypothetical protein [Bacteroidales bacterium]